LQELLKTGVAVGDSEIAIDRELLRSVVKRIGQDELLRASERARKRGAAQLDLEDVEYEIATFPDYDTTIFVDQLMASMEETLSPRAYEIVRLYMNGFSNGETAVLLGLSQRTVARQLQVAISVMRQLAGDTR
jgi:DNA-directed RNA polymerase specialized sigma24 family protein